MLAELIVSAVTLAASAETPMPGTAVIGKSSVPWPIGSGLMDFGVKTTSESYTDGHFSITAPMFSNIGQDGTLGGSLVFLEPYISWGEQGEVAASLGVGFRHLFNNQPLSALQERHAGWLDQGVMVGGNLFADLLDTQSDNRFWQFGVGLEFETRYFALRGNYYHPLSDRQEGEPILQRDVQRATLITSGKEPFAAGHTIQQDVTFTTFDFYTDRLYRYYEEGMKGWDVEAGVLVPGLDKWCELWLIAGYGDFQNKPFGPQIGGTGEMHGWKAGVEFRPIPQLVLSAMHFEEERMQGGEWMYGLSLQLPLDPEPANKDKSWWKKIKDSLRPRSRHLAERAVVPVHRQNAAVKIANSISEPEVTVTPIKLSSREERVIVRDDVIFVNNSHVQRDGIAANGVQQDGTAEHPFDTIQKGTDLAATQRFQARGAPTVFVVGGGAPYDENVVFGVSRSGEPSYETANFGNSILMASGGYGVSAFGGWFFGVGPAAIVNDVRIGGRDVGFDGFVVKQAIFVNADSSAQIMGNDVKAGWISVMLGPNPFVNVVNADPSIRDRSARIESNRVFWTDIDMDKRIYGFLSAVFVGAFGGDADITIRDNQLTIGPMGQGEDSNTMIGVPTAIFLNSGMVSPRWDYTGTPPSPYYVPTSVAANFSGNLVTSYRPSVFMRLTGGPIDLQSDDNNILLGDWSILFQNYLYRGASTTSFLLLNGHEFEP